MNTKRRARKLRLIMPFFLCLILLSAIIPEHVRAEKAYTKVLLRNIKVNGVIKDDTGQPVPGASIKIKGHPNIGTISDSDGKYVLDAPADAVLIVSALGFTAKEVSVDNRTVINVVLVYDVSKLGEVVVVGYGTVKKSDVTGAVTSLKRDDFNQGAITSADQLIAGKASGVQVVQNSAEPGGGISVNIRGSGSINASNSPLYVVDGLPLDNSAAVTGASANFLKSNSPRNPLNSINPADIQSIEILKDASATAIYGSRGANGVVLITTRNGGKGALKIDYDTYAGVQNVAHKVRLLNATEYQSTINALIDAGGGTAAQRVNSINGGGTDWLAQLYKSNAVVQSHNLSFSGGNENTSYLVSLNYFGQDGVLINSGYDRIGARVNIETRVADRFKVGMNLNTSYGKDVFVSNGFDLNERAGILYAGFNYDPTLSIRNATTGRYTLSSDLNIDNPLAIANGKTSFSNVYRTLGTFFGEYTVMKGLTAKLNLGGDVLSQRTDAYVDRTTIEGVAAGGIGSILQGNNSNYLAEATVNYNKVVKNHAFNALVGATAQKFIFDDVSSEARGFPSDATLTDNLGLGALTSFRSTSSKVSNSLLSYLGRLNYTLNDKYLITASFRIDGSSRFGVNNKYGYFPSVALGWKLDQESFIKNIESISALKIRASWGVTGNQEIGNYLSLETYATGNSAVFNDTQIATTSPTRISNPNLKWEAAEQINFGLDYGFLKNRITGSIEYFVKDTKDMLLSLPIPRETGFTTSVVNIGSVKNSGFEFSINSRNLTGKFQWTTNLNLSTLKNEVTNLGGIANIISGAAGQSTNISIIKEGSPLYSFYGYKVLGIWQTGDDFSSNPTAKPGTFKFQDLNGDKLINADDRMILGNSFPKLIYAMGNNFSYKGFGLYVFIEGVNGVSMLNNNLVDTYFPANLKRNRLAEPLLNRWTATNPSKIYPSFVNTAAQSAQAVNSYTVEDASYIRLNTVKFSYSLPVKGKTFKNASVYVSGQNLATITDYTGYDPALNPNGGANFRVDWNAYPTARTFLVGISVGL
jgi:TonB-linked SusC/RagA family outer membrane protein